MTERVKNLIENLRFTKIPLGYACYNLGFNESDLSSDELDELYGMIFQCGCCDVWEPADEFHNLRHDFICANCYESMGGQVEF